MGVRNVGTGAEPLFRAGQGSLLIINNDTAATIWLGTSPTALTIPLPPQAGITVDGTTVYWAATDGSYASEVYDAVYGGVYGGNPATVQVLILPGGTSWSNPVGVQVAIDNLGLATSDNQLDQTSAINNPAYGPATSDLQNTQMSQGIPPNIPNIVSAAKDDLTPATYTLATFDYPSRLWYGHIGLAVATNGADDANPYASGLMRIYAQYLVGGNVVRTAQCAIGSTGETMESHSDITFGGLEVAAGTEVTVNVNGGTGGITGLYITASADVLGSTP